MEQTEEIARAIESASNGMWVPILTISTVFSLLIALLLIIWKITWKNNDKRHTDNEDLLKEVAETTKKMGDLLIKIESKQEHQQKEIDQLIGKTS